jgi:D-alanyl-D-alanine carboxypeptidase/D-alanyl-D-alanine-endopeptidase (penicillin-binding protein 4)
MSVMVGNDGQAWYRHGVWVERPPASNEKLLLSMVLLDRYGTDMAFQTRALSTDTGGDGTIDGDLWLVGEGDPLVADQRLEVLARRIAATGITRIRGSVIGSTKPFQRDWFAPGWKDYFPEDYVALPTALTFRRNTAGGVHITDPELRAASYLTARLRDLGVRVADPPAMGRVPDGLLQIAHARSSGLAGILTKMNRRSVNFLAEVLGKRLGLDARGTGSIAAGAAALCGWESARGVRDATCHDGSGLSYANRQTTRGIVRLLWHADDRPWGPALRHSLTDGGEGTMKERLSGLRLRVKTGTLDNVSALSGWVWNRTEGTWIEFSILSSGMDEWAAKELEDDIVRVLARGASDPS